MYVFYTLFFKKYIIRTIKPKCTKENSLKYSILISLHYYDLNNHKERINQLNKYMNKYNFTSNNYNDFENNNPYISLTVYDEYEQILYKSLNNSNNKAYIVKMNHDTYLTWKPKNDKYTQSKNLLKQFTHKELTDLIINKIIH